MVAGASGIIGSYFSKNLKGFDIIASIGFSTQQEGKNFFKVNLLNKNDIKLILKRIPRCNVLLFFVGLAHKKGKNKDLEDFKNINNKTLVNLVTVLDREDVLPEKIIFASTISVYGETLNQNTYFETCVPKPISPYAKTKLDAEKFLIDNYFKRSWILRLAPVYSKHFKLNLRVRSQIMGRFYRVGDGKIKLSLCHIHNILHVVSNIIEDKVPLGIYNISDMHEYTYNDILLYFKAKKLVVVPKFFIKIVYYVGVLSRHIALKERSIKLITDNIFPSTKIQKHLILSKNLFKE